MKSGFIGGVIILLIIGIFMASWAKGEGVESRNILYYDQLRDIQIEVIFYKKVAHLSGNNFGPKIELLNDSENIFKNEKNNITLLKKEDEVIIFIGKKKVFEGQFQENDKYKNIKDVLLSNVWLWKNAIVKDDELVKPNRPEMFNLSFSQEGRVLATTDCADFEGAYELKDNEVIISDLFQKKKICDNLEGEKFVNFLSQINSFNFDSDNNLILFLKNNTGSLSFIKK